MACELELFMRYVTIEELKVTYNMNDLQNTYVIWEHQLKKFVDVVGDFVDFPDVMKGIEQVVSLYYEVRDGIKAGTRKNPRVAEAIHNFKPNAKPVVVAVVTRVKFVARKGSGVAMVRSDDKEMLYRYRKDFHYVEVKPAIQ
jgi:hypothetical protein